jgi:hypothetical protein
MKPIFGGTGPVIDAGGIMVKNRCSNNEMFWCYKNKSYFVEFLTKNVNRDRFYTKKNSELDVLHKVIESYYVELKKELSVAPLGRVVSILEDAMMRMEKEKVQGVCLDKADIAFRCCVPDELGRSKFKSLFNVGDIIQAINTDMNLCWRYVEKNQDDVAVIKKNFDDYVVVKAKCIVIDRLKESSSYDKIQAVLMCISALLRLDLAMTYAFCDSDEYKLRIVKDAGKKNAASYHAIRRRVLSGVGPKADKMWREGSKLLHYKMIEELMPELNQELRVLLLESLEESFLKKKGAYKNNEVYERRKLKITSGKCDFTYEAILPHIKKVAKAHLMYFDPAEDSRESKK